MFHEPKHVLIAGGTGFIGSFSKDEFIKKGIQVTSLAHPSESKKNDENCIYLDLFDCSTADIDMVFQQNNFDTIVYALGPDDRVTPKGDAFTFFYQRLVEAPKRFLNVAKQYNVRKVIVLGSYFSYFNRLSKYTLELHHPYIKVRHLQEEALFSLSEEHIFEVVFLELPYIFGIRAGLKPIWKEHFLDHFAKYKKVYLPYGGGTSVTTVKNVAKAVVAASIYGDHLQTIPISDYNITFKDLFRLMLDSSNQKKKIVQLPDFLMAWGVILLLKKQKKAGIEAGLDYFYLLKQIMNHKFYIPEKEYCHALRFEELGYNSLESIFDVIKITIEECYK